MNKLFVSIAAMSLMFMTGCQNEEIVKQASNGDYTLTLDMGAKSRTLHNENGECVWGENEAIYVVGDGGKVFGTLTMKSKSDDGKKAVFSGKVTGDPAKLQFMVYPVPEADGTIPMGNIDGTNHNAPMTGNISGGVVEDVDYAGGLIQIPMNGQSIVNVNATNEDNLTVSGGSYTFNPETGELTFDPNGGTPISISADEGTKYVYAPVHSTVPTGENETESITVEITIGNDENEEPQSFEVEIQQGAISTGIPSTEVGEDGEINYAVETESQLNTALSRGGEVKLTGNIVAENGITIPAGKGAILDLNGRTITGIGSNAVITNEGALRIEGNGIIEHTVINGQATINNKGTLVLDGVAIIGAPIGGESGYPAYCITSSGNLTIEAGTSVTADRGCLFLSGNGVTDINGGILTNVDISEKLGGRAFTSHVVVVGYGANNKLTINDGVFQHLHTTTSGGVVINNWSAVTVDINGGNFSGGDYYGKWDNLSEYGFGSTGTPFSVKGGTFTGMDSNFLAEGYEIVENEDGTKTVVKSNE